MKKYSLLAAVLILAAGCASGHMGSTGGTARTPRLGARGVTPLDDPDTRYNAPSYSVAQPRAVRSFDQAAREPQPSARTTGQGLPAMAETGVVEIPLYREQLQVGKRVVPKGGVVLRKIVETDTRSEPVELRREEFVIERVTAEEAQRLRQSGAANAFQDREVLIELNREEPVVEKTATLKEVVRARKTIDTRNEVVSGTVRRETIDIDRAAADGAGNRAASSNDAGAMAEFSGASAGSSQGSGQGGTQSSATREQQDGAELFLHEEELKVGKRVVPAGQVVLRKNVTSEEVSRPIELREEDVRVERAQATGNETEGARANAFRAREIYIPLNQEVPTVQKRLELVEVIRAGKRVDTEQQTVSGEVRSERVEVAETRGTNAAAGSSAVAEEGNGGGQGSENTSERK